MSNLLPLSELPSAHDVDPSVLIPSVTWDVELPGHVDTERLMLDADHLHRIQKLGYFASNHFYSYQGETTQYEPTIMGMNPDGTAIAGRKASRTKRADESKTIQQSRAPFGIDDTNYFSVLARHDINRNEVSRMVSEKLEGKPRDDDSQQQVWADTLDDVLQKSLRKSASDNLLWRSKGFARYFEYGYMGMMSMFIAENIALNHPQGVAVNVAWLAARKGVSVATNSRRNRMITGESHIQERRWSVFEGIQPERYVALNGLTRVNSLIKYRK